MMAVPRKDDDMRHGDKWAGGRGHHAARLPQGRPVTPTEAQRLYRAGHRGQKGIATLVWSEPNPRLALPFRPYVYRGTGADAFTGEVVL